MKYEFKEIFKHPKGGSIGIDIDKGYGYWEYSDGTEGGGLWFYVNEYGIYLEDYDGAFDLPQYVKTVLKDYGINSVD